MIVKTFNNLDFINFFNDYESEKLGLFFSFGLHLIIIMFMIGIPNFFEKSPIIVPNIIPIEIINIADITSVPQKNSEIKNELTENESPKPKKFNNVDTTKKFNNNELTENESPKPKKFNNVDNTKKFNNIELQESNSIEIKSKPKLDINDNANLKNIKIQEKKIQQNNKEMIDINENKKILEKKNIESLPTKKIKPKIKPKPETIDIATDRSKDIKVNIKEKIVDTNNLQKSDIDVTIKPKPKPKQTFDIASMLKDLRNDQRSFENNNKLDDTKITKKEKINSDTAKVQLSISEIDLLIQQLSSCWTAPAGSVIKKGMKVKISAKIKPDRNVLNGSVRIVDTNISKNNPFYGPITESAMRTLLNPECSPLKLPLDKYDLWKNLIIIFDHSIMKGY